MKPIFPALPLMMMLIALACGTAITLAGDPQIHALAEQGIKLSDDAAKRSDELLLHLTDAGRDKQADTKRITELEQQLTDQHAWVVGLLAVIVGGAGVPFLIGGFIGFCNKVNRSAVVSTAGGLALIGLGVTIATKFDEIGWFCIAGAGVIVIAVIAWLIIDLRNHKDAAIENGSLVSLAESSGAFTDDTIAKLKQLAYAEGSKLADSLRAIAAGKSVADLKAEASGK